MEKLISIRGSVQIYLPYYTILASDFFYWYLTKNDAICLFPVDSGKDFFFSHGK